MISLLITIILLIAAYYITLYIRKNNITLYTITTILAIIAFYFIDNPIMSPIRLGGLGFAFFYVVMLTGALKQKSKLRIKLMQVRREYSIIGFILITPHALYQSLQFFTGDIVLPILGILAYSVMVPLFITSFKTIRREMSHKSWKKLQQLAYIVYLGLFIHLVLHSELPNIAIYIALFVVYVFLKIKYILHTKAKNIVTV